jgi:predicted small secreted protein
MKWLEKDWFKIGVLLLLFIGVYYLISNDTIVTENVVKNTTTNRDISRTNLDIAKQCKDDSQHILQIDGNKARNINSTNCWAIQPQYLYHEDKDTCLYFGGYQCDFGTYVKWHRHITDVYTNELIDVVYVDNSNEVEDWEREAYNKFWDVKYELGFPI